MKKLLLLSLINVLWASEGLSEKCEKATNLATATHMLYVEGKVTLTQSYNVAKLMDKACGTYVEKGDKHE